MLEIRMHGNDLVVPSKGEHPVAFSGNFDIKQMMSMRTGLPLPFFCL
jgi:hypothetical protein